MSEGFEQTLGEDAAAVFGLDGPAEILDACCGGRMWWWDKAHPLAVYMDKREAPHGSIEQRPNWNCSPDLFGDFRYMPFADESFQLILFDPPHIIKGSGQPTGILGMRYGALKRDTARDDLRLGLSECWRVLKPGGTLIFKWAGDLGGIDFPAQPIVGTRSRHETRWLVFYKPLERRFA